MATHSVVTPSVVAHSDGGKKFTGPQLTMELGHKQFLILWSITLLSRATCAIFLCATGVLYLFMTNVTMEFYANMVTANPRPLFTASAVLYLLLGAAHGYRMLHMTVRSIKCRRLAFESDATEPTEVLRSVASTLKRMSASSRSSKATVSDPSLAQSMTSWQRFGRYVNRIYQLVFSRQGFFGIESGYFDVRFVTREAIEIVSQTSQVYTSSVLIGKHWINALYVAIIVINCWSTPLVQRLTRHSPPLERLVCLLTDAFLDSGTSMLMPLIIFAPYWQQFDRTIYTFESILLYDDVWYMTLINESRQLFATDVLDLILKLIPHLSIFSCLSSVKTLVRVSGNHQETIAIAVPSLSPQAPEPKPPMAQRQLHGCRAKIIHLAFFLWGLGVLVLHVVAMQLASSIDAIGCKQTLRPWFSTEYSCLVYEFNCFAQQKSSLEPGDLDFLASDPLAFLLMSHCPALVVPSDIRRFPKLLGLDMYNCTIVDWPQSAGVTEATHPQILYVGLVRTKMTTLPDGLLYDLPASLTDIELSMVNLTTLPEDLDERWSNLWVLYIEHSNWTAIPDVLMRMAVPQFSLIGNQIQEIPAVNETSKTYYAFSISHNPIRILPEAAGPFQGMSFLSIEHTLIETLPAWVYEAASDGTATQIFASDTPFCNAQSPEAIASTYGEDQILTCSLRDADGSGRYPLAMIDQLRQLK